MKGLAVTDLCQTEIPRVPALKIHDKSILSKSCRKIKRSETSSTKAGLFVDRVQDQVVQDQFLLWSWVGSFKCKGSEVRSELRSSGIHVQQRSVINSFSCTLLKVDSIKIVPCNFSSVKD